MGEPTTGHAAAPRARRADYPGTEALDRVTGPGDEPALLVTLGHYPTLFASTAIAAAIGATLVWRIKSVP